MAWQQLIISNTSPKQTDSVSDILTAFGAQTITVQCADEEEIFEPTPGSSPMWQRSRLIALFPADQNCEPVLQFLQMQFENQFEISIEHLEDQDWVRASQLNFHAMQFGKRLWICPSWEMPPDPKAVNVILDPGLAFGSGTHPTTALCLEWLGSHIVSCQTVIDYGCGSGILAIAALKLGASKVIGVDIDPQALAASEINAKRNGVEKGLETYFPHELPPLQADLLIANILAGPLTELVSIFNGLVKPGGQIILSGVLNSQTEAIMEAYQAHFELSPPLKKDGWILINGKKKT